MKSTIIAALTSATLASPAFADSDQGDVFDCFTETLDEQIEMLKPMKEALAQIFTMETNLPFTAELETGYSHAQKQEFISDCEASTGQTATGKSTGLTSYSNGHGVTITFAPKTP